MSLQVITDVWRVKAPPHVAFVLVALADFADDDGGSIFPSVATIAWKTNYSPRQVQRTLSELRDKGVLIGERPAYGVQPPLYRLDLSKLPQKPARPGRRSMGGDNMTPLTPVTPGGDAGDTPGVTPATGRGDAGVRGGVTPVSPKPLVNRQEPSREPSLDPSMSRPRQRPTTRAHAREGAPSALDGDTPRGEGVRISPDVDAAIGARASWFRDADDPAQTRARLQHAQLNAGFEATRFWGLVDDAVARTQRAVSAGLVQNGAAGQRRTWPYFFAILDDLIRAEKTGGQP